MAERIVCPDASVCFDCAARTVELNRHYCDTNKLNLPTSSGAITTRPTFCPREREDRKKAEQLEVTRQLRTLLARR